MSKEKERISNYNRFKNLWKVKLLTSLKELDDMDGRVERGEKESIERDLRMIRYGFEQGCKIAETTEGDSK